MGSGGWNWVLIVLAVLVVIVIWAVLRKRSSPRSPDETERATREAYREEEERRRSGDDGV